MTDYEKLMGSLTSSVEPDFEGFSTWSSKRDIEEDEVDRRVNYSDYIRKAYVDAGAISVKAEGETLSYPSLKQPVCRSREVPERESISGWAQLSNGLFRQGR